MIENTKLGRRHVGVPHQFLGEGLARFNLGGGLCGPENLQSRLLKGIDDTLGERIFGANHRQTDRLPLCKPNQTIKIIGFEREICSLKGGAGIPRRTEDLIHAWRLSEFPNQGMFAAAFADDEYFHGDNLAIAAACGFAAPSTTDERFRTRRLAWASFS